MVGPGRPAGERSARRGRVTVPLSDDLVRFVRRSGDTPVLSAYVHSAFHDPAAKHAWRTELRRVLRVARARCADDEEREEYDACAARLMTALPSESVLHRLPGWFGAVGCDGEIVATGLLRPVQTAVYWQHGPFLPPLLTADVPAPVWLLLVDSATAQLRRLDHDGWEDIAHTDHGLPQVEAGHMGSPSAVGFHGGTRGETATEHRQRREREVWDTLRTEIVRWLSDRVDADGLVLIGGIEALAHQIIEQLPPAVAVRTHAAPALRRGIPDTDLRSKALELVPVLQAARQERWLHDLLERAYTDRHAALGLDAVRRAVVAGAVERVVLSDHFLQAHPEDADRVTADAIRQGAVAESLERAASPLVDQRAGGIAARLRFAVPFAASGVAEHLGDSAVVPSSPTIV